MKPGVGSAIRSDTVSSQPAKRTQLIMLAPGWTQKIPTYSIIQSNIHNTLRITIHTPVDESGCIGALLTADVSPAIDPDQDRGQRALGNRSLVLSPIKNLLRNHNIKE